MKAITDDALPPNVEAPTLESVPAANSGLSTPPVGSNGFGRNGDAPFSGKTVEEVREVTARFFIETLNQTTEEAESRAKLLTTEWAEDLELVT